MKILVVTAQYYPDRGSSGAIYTDLCEDLAKRGHDVSVVCGFPHYGGPVWPEYRGKLAQREVVNGVKVTRVYVHGNRKKIGGRMLYHVLFNLAATAASIGVWRPSVIIADAPVLWSGLPLVVKALLLRTPFIYVVHDIYPDIAVRLGVLANRRAITLWDRLERIFYRKARALSVLAEGLKMNLVQKGVPAGKITVIPACTDTDFIRPLAGENRYRREWGLEGKFVVLYAGNLGQAQGLEHVIEMAVSLKEHPEIAVVLVGDGNAREELQARATQMQLTNVRFFPMQDRKDVPEVYALADVSVVSLDPQLAEEAVPSKTFSIMASGRAMVAFVQEKSEIAHLIRKSGCGVRVDPGNRSQAAEAVLQLYRDEQMRLTMGRNGRDYVVQHFSRSVAADAYENLIRMSHEN